MPSAPKNRALYAFVVNLKSDVDSKLKNLPFKFEPNGDSYDITIRHRPKRQDGSKVDVKYLAFSIEMGVKAEHFHLQGMLELDARLQPHTVGKWLCNSWVAISRDWNALYEYTRKVDDETFISGPYEFGKFINKKPGKRSDIEDLTDMINEMAGKGLSKKFIIREVYKQFPSRMASQHKGVEKMIDISIDINKPQDDPSDIKLRPWQQNLVDELKKKPDNRRIYWVYDSKGNVGKSFLAMYLMKFMDAIQLCGKGADMAYAYDGERIVIFDVPRTSEENASSMYTMAERLKSGYVFSTKYESKGKIFPSPHVIFFANFLPPTDPRPWSEDRLEGSIINLDEMLGNDDFPPFA